jgi:23S rRNA (pseudouridine1915-N3)-methyltransferase
VKVTGIVVGGVKGPVAEVIEEYTRRISHYFRFEWSEVPAGAGRNTDPAAVMSAEGERILARVPERAVVVALDRRGKGMGSPALAEWLSDAALHGQDVAFVIGGAFGLDGAVLDRAERRLSLSTMTLPHEIARLVLAEQIYRAGTIQRNEPYHKGAR